MNLSRKFLLSIPLLILSACATIPDISQSRSPCRMEPGGWCEFVREGAVEAYPYAIASLQAYVGDSDLYKGDLPNLKMLGDSQVNDEDKRTGFDYRIFELSETMSFGWFSPLIPDRTVTKARIMAFRGTDFDGLTDIFYGTLGNTQINLALKYFEIEKEAAPKDGVPWVVAGHSLGGALATEVSVANPEVRAFMFNTSPFYGGDAMSNDVQRTVFNERGELLRRFAKYKVSPAAEVFTINCGPGNDTFTKHRIRLLADCLTWIAAYSDKDAFDFVKAQGIERPMVECRRETSQHPGVGHIEILPCVHQTRPEKDESTKGDDNN